LLWSRTVSNGESAEPVPGHRARPILWTCCAPVLMMRPMALTIVVRSNASGSPPGISFDAPRIVIGRGASCDVRLPDPSVSQRHASVRQRGTEYIVVDEGSTNGTFVGPVRLSPQAPRVLRPGDLIRVGRIWLEVRFEPAPATHNPQAATRELALSLVEQALAADGDAAGARLDVIEGPDAGASLKLEEFERPYVVGRGKTCDLPLTDDDASRRHVEVVRRGAQLLVRDLGSKNGTTLAGAALLRDKTVPWAATALLAIGSNRLRFHDPVSEALVELEQMADEHMRDDESIDPPKVEAIDGSSGTQAPAGPPAEAKPRPSGGAAASIAARPVRRSANKGPGGWNGTDVLVVLLALAVLGLSLAGLYWLFRTN
jgi:pSer/pThr/pTyr-binding forkhead associated (FHA) protein